jgi:hypothetical protein
MSQGYRLVGFVVIVILYSVIGLLAAAGTILIARKFLSAKAGMRLPFILIAGYSLHGIWDLVDELQAHGAYSAFPPDQLTDIPLGYGFFCAAFDFCMAGYFYARPVEWRTAWKAAATARTTA